MSRSVISGVTLPFRNLRQLMQNITYFASVVWKICIWSSQSIKVQMKIVKRKSIHARKIGNIQEICCLQRVWIDWNIVHSIIFWRWTAVDDVGKPSSCLPQDLVTRWSSNWGCCHILSFVFSVITHFVFGFVVSYILSKFWYTIRLGILASSKFHTWDRIFCWLTGNYHWSVWQDMWFLARLIVICRETNSGTPILLPVR